MCLFYDILHCLQWFSTIKGMSEFFGLGTGFISMNNMEGSVFSFRFVF
jgi:hypothetical protein